MRKDQPRYTTSYLHGTDPEEQQRLSRLNELLNVRCLSALAAVKGNRIVDVGSGLGQFSRALAREVGSSGAVVGIEGDPRQISEARRLANEAGEQALVEFREGDAYSLPLNEHEWGTFDIAHTRFVLEHVREPLTIVRQMAIAVKPGGRVILADDDHEMLRLWPDVPEVLVLWNAYMRTYDSLGNDSRVGRKLVALLHNAGLLPRKNTILFFGSCQGDPHFEEYISNFVHVLLGARETILSLQLLQSETFDRALAMFQQWSKLPDVALWYGLCWAEGMRPLMSDSSSS